jgi:hypothetical protein
VLDPHAVHVVAALLSTPVPAPSPRRRTRHNSAGRWQETTLSRNSTTSPWTAPVVAVRTDSVGHRKTTAVHTYVASRSGVGELHSLSLWLRRSCIVSVAAQVTTAQVAATDTGARPLGTCSISANTSRCCWPSNDIVTGRKQPLCELRWSSPYEQILSAPKTHPHTRMLLVPNRG